MRPIKTTDSNVTLTLPGGTSDNDLPALRAMLYNADAGQTPEDAQLGYVTTWMPTEAEARQLEAGGMVQITVWGNAHPPIACSVTSGVMPERELVNRQHVDRALGHLYAAVASRIDASLSQIIRADVPLAEVVLGAEQVGTEVLGLPGPAAFADLWADAVAATRESDAPSTPPDTTPAPVPNLPGAHGDPATIAGALTTDPTPIPPAPYTDCGAPDYCCPTPRGCRTAGACLNPPRTTT